MKAKALIAAAALGACAAASAAPEIKIDASNAPELAEWARTAVKPELEKFAAVIEKRFPARMPDANDGPITFRFDNIAPTPAYCRSILREITMDIEFAKNEKEGEAVGAAIHELVHVYQAGQNAPGWFIEGMADYLRWFVYEPEKNGAPFPASAARRAPKLGEHPRIAANFLNWFSLEYGEKSLLDVHEYYFGTGKGRTETIWKSLTGKTLNALQADWIAAKGEPSAKRADPTDPLAGHWAMSLPFASMSAGTITAARKEDGSMEAVVLWRWAHAVPADECTTEGRKFRISHKRCVLEGEISPDLKTFLATAVNPKDGKPFGNGEVKGWRVPPVNPAFSVKDAKFGKPVDLLAQGLDGWTSMDPKAKFGWSISEEDGVKILSNKLGLKPDGSWAGGGANICSKRSDFKDFKLEYDVRVPKGSNSGVYLRGRFEIQVVDSYGKEPGFLNMAALYGRIVPSCAAEKAPGEWQHVSVVLYKRHLTVALNGTVIIDDKPVPGVTGGAIDADDFLPGPIYLQGDHSDADYKNMILYPAVN